MDKFVVITCTKVLDDWEKGEIQDICDWQEQELNTDFTYWDWNSDDQVYELDRLVDADDCDLTDDEYEQWKQGKLKAYRVYSRAEVYNLVRVRDVVGDKESCFAGFMGKE